MTLNHLALKHRTDKWGPHAYTPLYERHIGHLREQPIKLLELGVGGYGESSLGGESLRMWKDYFGQAEIWGVDIFPKQQFEEERIHIVQGAQDDPALVAQLAEIGPFDVIVDDCSHQMGPTIRSFELLFPHLAYGGWYVIEDLETSYNPAYGGTESGVSKQTVMRYLLDRTNLLNYRDFIFPYEPSDLDRDICGICFYKDIAFIEKRVHAPGIR